MAEEMTHTSLGEAAARNLAHVTKTQAQMGAIGPRWLLKLLPWVDVEAGRYRVNRVRVVGEEFERVETRVDGERVVLDAGHLRSIPLFRGLSSEILTSLAKLFETRQVPAGKNVVREGDEADELFIVARGKVEVYRSGDTGRPVILSVLRAGDFFGEVGLLRHDKRNASVRALTPTLVLALSRKGVDSQLDADPTLRDTLDQAATQRTGAHGKKIELTTTQDLEAQITVSVVDYEEAPREITLSSIFTVLRLHSRIMDLFKEPFDQLREQARLVIEAMKERQEWELVNNPAFGLLASAVPSLRIPTRQGPPTPDDLDELLSCVWKEPAFFLAHPLAIAAFGRECTRRGVPPPTVQLFGSSFITWRGIPLIPCDKLPVDYSGQAPTTKILLMRVGADRRGVVGLHQTNIGDERLPSFALRFNGIDAMGVANYLVSLYFSAAVLADDAIACLEGVELGNFHEYKD